ncbi:DNA-binding protein YbaB [Nocardioides ginsengisegetis]|uniref:DNA-binding protein YbaB n=1 Tax=Nocardioides ginsengisegetis TaxID=661491 RepID=A0A7W3J422_9ACTN|nr:YbaB/EbfC family nucleoid-associated protein [Nocardioides ginsengisegetis]MBA8805804.1 DNA-binding protein YbaB [Nocardioides ginsengisegetis]
MPEPLAPATPMEQEWERTEVEVESPNGRVRVTLRGDHALTLWVDPTWYATVPVDALESELARTARLAYVERTRAYYRTWSRLAGREMRPATVPASPEQAEYLDRLQDVHAEGSADGGRVVLTMVGLSQFAVTIDPAVLRELDAPAFASVAARAALDCLAAHNRGWQELHAEVYLRNRPARAMSW